MIVIRPLFGANYSPYKSVSPKQRGQICKGGREMKVQVTSGDITAVPVDAIVTLINSGGLWFGGVDRAISSVAGDLYHRQARAEMPLRNRPAAWS